MMHRLIASSTTCSRRLILSSSSLLSSRLSLLPSPRPQRFFTSTSIRHNSSSSNSSRHNHEESTDPSSSWLNLARLGGGIAGLYGQSRAADICFASPSSLVCCLLIYFLDPPSSVAFRVCIFVNDKFVDPQGAAERRGASSSQQSSPFPHITIPPMSPSSHTLTQIFTSVLSPLVEFDHHADEFVERKTRAHERMAAILLRRRTSAVPQHEIQSAEVEMTRMESMERTEFRPRLEYLTELYFQRSKELMLRSQSLAERRFHVKQALQEDDRNATDTADSVSTKKTKLTSAERASLTSELGALDSEMSDFQAVCQSNQHLLTIVRKYNLFSADHTYKRQMMTSNVNSAPPPPHVK